MAFPGSNVHRVSRRKLGRGQHYQLPSFTVGVASSGSTVTLTFSQAVIVSGTIPLNVGGGLTLVSQTVNNPTTVTQVYSGAVSGQPWSVSSAAPVLSSLGGSLTASNGVFGVDVAVITGIVHGTTGQCTVNFSQSIITKASASSTILIGTSVPTFAAATGAAATATGTGFPTAAGQAAWACSGGVDQAVTTTKLAVGGGIVG